MNYLRLLLLTMIIPFSTKANSQQPDHFILVEDGQPRAVILLPESPAREHRESAQELNYWIERITGTTLPIQTVNSWDKKTPWIAIGENKLTQQQGWSIKDLGIEGATVVIDKDKIALLGALPVANTDGRNGIHNATLEFIRHALNVYWIWPGEIGEVYEPTQTLKVTTGQWSWKPDIPWTRQLRLMGNNLDALQRALNRNDLSYDPKLRPELEARAALLQQWSKRQRMTKEAVVPIDGQYFIMRFGHSFTQWWDRFGDKHPDWFAKPPAGVSQMGGKGVKLNLSNPEVHEQIFKDWLAEYRRAPNSSASKFVRVGPNDSRGFDTRAATRAWDPPSMKRFSDQEIWNGSEPVLTDRYVRFWNTIMEKIHKVDPTAYATTYAYRNYQKPPQVEKLNERIIIGYVGGEGYYPKEPWIRDEWKGWTDKGARLKIWRPNLLHAGHGIPWLYSKQLFEDFRYLQQHGLMGTDFDSLTSNWAAQGLNYYVLSEIHYRSDVDYETLLKEYCDAFGPASGTIREYLKYFEELTAQAPDLLREHKLVSRETWGGWWEAHIRVIPLMLTDQVLNRAQELLNKAYAETENSRPVYRKRVEAMLQSHEHQALMAKVYRELQLHKPEQRKDYRSYRELLMPLWELRQRMATSLVFNAFRLTQEEQRQLGIWAAFTNNQVATKPKETKVLSEGWTILPDPKNEGMDQSWFKQIPESNKWIPAQTEKRWNLILQDQGLYTNEKDLPQIVWYKLNFEVPILSDTNNRATLYFESVDAEVHIWINGWLVGERSWPNMGNYDSWKEPFAVDISSAMREGPDNTLILRIRNEKGTGGITGKVILVTE